MAPKAPLRRCLLKATLRRNFFASVVCSSARLDISPVLGLIVPIFFFLSLHFWVFFNYPSGLFFFCNISPRPNTGLRMMFWRNKQMSNPQVVNMTRFRRIMYDFLDEYYPLNGTNDDDGVDGDDMSIEEVAVKEPKEPEDTKSLLEDKCLSSIFAYLNLNERLTLRGVCKRWCGVIEEMCSTQTSLIIAGYDIVAENTCYLLLRHIDVLPQLPDILYNLFPSIVNLQLVISHETSLYHYVFDFLPIWRSISSLLIFKPHHIRYDVDFDFPLRLTEFIDAALPQLTRLTLHFPLRIIEPYSTLPDRCIHCPFNYEMPTSFKGLSRLEELSLFQYGGDVPLLKSRLNGHCTFVNYYE